VGLAAVIYLIVNDAIDKRIENCLLKHIEKAGFLANVTLDRDLSKITETEEDCAGILVKAGEKTQAKINSITPPGSCMRTTFSSKQFFSGVMFAGVLEKIHKVDKAREVSAGLQAKVLAYCKDKEAAVTASP